MAQHRVVAVAAVFLQCFPAALLLAQAEARVGAMSFADYFVKLSGDSLGLPAQYARYGTGENLFQFRRVQLWADGMLGASFSARVLLEANDASLDAGRRYSPFLKEVSLSWDLPASGLQLQAGLIPTLTWRLSEAIWGYRSLEKTLTDFWGWGSATDLGLSLRVRLERGGRELVSTAVMMSSGEGVRAESNRRKKVSARCAVQPFTGLWLEGYADWESPAQGQEVLQLKGFLGYQSPWLSLGGELLLRSQRGFSIQQPVGLSFFGHLRVWKTPECRVVLRYDRVDSDRRHPTAAVYHFGLLAVDCIPLPQVHLLPNLWLLAAEQMYPQVVPRVTVSVRYP